MPIFFSCRAIIDKSEDKPTFFSEFFLAKKEPSIELLSFLHPVFTFISNALHEQILLLQNQYGNQLNIGKEKLLNIVFADLREKLQEMSMRCLVVHMNHLKLQKQLVGNTGEEQSAFFIKRMLEKSFVFAFFDKYPELENRLDFFLKNYVKAKKSFFKSCYQNFKKICLLLEKDSSSQCIIEDARVVGDVHNEGEAAVEVWLNFENVIKKLIYKPRGAGILKTYVDYCAQFNRYSDLKIYSVEFITSGEGCWIKFIDFEQCKSEEQVKKYYQNLGCLLANMLFLRGRDVHFENIIAHCDRPYLVDHECLFSPALTKAQETISLIDTLIIPPPVNPTNIISSFDVSAFGKTEEQILPIKSLDFKFGGENFVRFSKTAIKLAAQKNIPKLHDEMVDPKKFIGEFLEGFKIAYCCIMQRKKNLEKCFPALLEFRKKTVRILIKPTLFYRKLLQESFHPLLLMNHQSANNFLRKQLSRQSDYFAYIDSELDALINGDIPYFSYGSPENSVAGWGGKIIDASLYMDAYSCVKKQAGNFSFRDLECHLDRIKEAIPV